MLGRRKERFVSKSDLLIAAIDENRRQLGAIRHHLGEEMRKPALWLDVGQRGFRAYSYTRAGFRLTAAVFGVIRLARFTRLLRLLPVAGVGWGAYRLMRR